MNLRAGWLIVNLGAGWLCGPLFVGSEAVIRDGFADAENMSSICFSSLMSTSDFVSVLPSLTVGALDAFLRQ